MNHREPTSVPPGTGQTMPCLALLIFSLLLIGRAWSRPMLPAPIIPSASKPYLGVLGAPPIRFQEPAPPPDLVTRPASGAPPQPAAQDETSSDVTPSAASHHPIANVSDQVPATVTPPVVIDSESHSPTEPSAPAKTPAPILRDDLHRQTHAEDFLPYFQIPITQSGDVMLAPVPRTPPPLPPSSATYTQTPK